MNPVHLPEHLLTPLQQIATEQGSSIDTIVDQIVTEYLRAQRHEKLMAEMEIFQEKHEELFLEYTGQFIGMYQGEVLGHNQDGGALYKQLHKKFGDLPILIVEVKDEPGQEFVRLHRRILA